MGLTAELFKIEGDLRITYTADGRQTYNKRKAKRIAYFRNNWEFHRFVDNGFDIVPLPLETLVKAKERAMYDEEFNKDYGEGQSVLSAMEDAIVYVKHGGCTIFYTAGY